MKEPLVMSKNTKQKLKTVSSMFKGKDMFPQKLASAKQMFKGLQVFPA